MKPKTIFFDVYQTLLSVNDSGNNEAWDVFSEFLKTYGIQISAEKFRETINLENQKYYKVVKDAETKYRHHSLLKSIKVVFLSYGIEIEKEELIDLIWEFRKKYSSNLEIYPGVKRMLKKLSEEYVLSVANYTQSSYTCKELEKF